MNLNTEQFRATYISFSTLIFFNFKVTIFNVWHNTQQSECISFLNFNKCNFNFCWFIEIFLMYYFIWPNVNNEFKQNINKTNVNVEVHEKVWRKSDAKISCRLTRSIWCSFALFLKLSSLANYDNLELREFNFGLKRSTSPSQTFPREADFTGWLPPKSIRKHFGGC